jgi:hypothetical protein
MSDILGFEKPFDPDGWTEFMCRGLEKSDDLCGEIGLEIGVGTGSISAHCIHPVGASKMWGADVVSENPVLALERILRLFAERPDLAGRFSPVAGSTDILKGQGMIPVFRDGVFFIVACLPQAYKPLHEDVRPDDYAHYYPRELYSHLPSAMLALSLNEEVLVQSKQFLPTADVFLNFAERFGRDPLVNLFRGNGYTPEIVDSSIVQQCPSTGLGFFVEMERKGVSTEFFGYADGGAPMMAATAERVRMNGDPVFHRLSLYRGRLLRVV